VEDVGAQFWFGLIPVVVVAALGVGKTLFMGSQNHNVSVVTQSSSNETDEMSTTDDAVKKVRG
jgi:hypothetical protein